MVRSRQIISNLGDVLKYPKFSSGHLASMSQADIDRLLFADANSLQGGTFFVRMYTKNSVQTREVAYRSSNPVHSLIEELRRLAGESGVEEPVLSQYGLFLAFGDDTADIALPFDTQ